MPEPAPQHETEIRELIKEMNARDVYPGISRAGKPYFVATDDHGVRRFLNGHRTATQDGEVLGPPWEWGRPYGLEFDVSGLGSVLRANGVTRLFHTTHRDNIVSIFEKGLLSTSAHASKAVTPVHASSVQSREIEARRGSSEYVKLGFIPRHPMFHGNPNVVTLEVDVDYVCGVGDTKFCRVNSIRNDAVLEPIADIGSFDMKTLVECIEKQEFDLNYRPGHGTGEWDACQAEILVPRSIPPEALRLYGG